MTYFAFHFIFLLPPLILLALQKPLQPASIYGSASRSALLPDSVPPPVRLKRVGVLLPARWHLRGLIIIAAIAFGYTTPWDNYLVHHGVWGYGDGRVAAVLGTVPVEEYLFFILQPLMTGMWLYVYLNGRSLRSTSAPETAPPRWNARVAGGVFFLILTALGAACLMNESRKTFYLGLILVWACPMIAFQWFCGGERLWRWRKHLAWGIGLPTLYLWVADWIALRQGIWYIAEHSSTGLHLLGLPIEEAIFFLVTNILIVQGLLLWLHLGEVVPRDEEGRESRLGPTFLNVTFGQKGE
jgi:lycopene cyclase domain-containing protein